MFRLSVYCVVIAFVYAQTPCIPSSPVQTYQSLKAISWSGNLVDFCADLYPSSTFILPVAENSCDGEFGQFTPIRRAMGSLHYSCQIALSKFMCFVALPKYRPPPINSIALPCTNSQKANPVDAGAKLLITWFEEECGSTAPILLAMGLQAAFDGMDGALMQGGSTGAGLRSICRVVDGGPADQPDDSVPGFAPTVWGCPDNLAKVSTEDLKEDGELTGCTLPCPGPFFTTKEWYSVDSLFRVLPLVSLVSLVILIVFWPVLGHRRMSYPTVFIFHLSLSLLIITISFLFRLGAEVQTGSQNSVLCHNDYKFADHNDAACVAQGFLFMLGVRNAVLMWCIIVLNMYLVVVRQSEWVKKNGHSIMIVCVVWAFVPTIIAAGMQKLSAAPAGPWCSIDQSWKGLYHFALGFGDVHLMLILCLIFPALLVIDMIKNKRGLPVITAKLSLLSFKLVIFLIWIFLGLLTGFYARVFGSIDEDAYTRDIVAYVKCSLMLFIAAPETFASGPNFDIDYSSCHIDHRPQYKPSMVAFCVLSTSGLLMFVMFMLPALLNRQCSSDNCVDEVNGLKLLFRRFKHGQSGHSNSNKNITAVAYMPKSFKETDAKATAVDMNL